MKMIRKSKTKEALKDNYELLNLKKPNSGTKSKRLLHKN